MNGTKDSFFEFCRLGQLMQPLQRDSFSVYDIALLRFLHHADDVQALLHDGFDQFL